MSTVKKSSGYIRRTKETVLRMEVSYNKDKINIPVMGIRNLSLFCKTVMLSYTKVELAIQGARANKQNTITVDNWTFTWMSIDEVRSLLTSKKVPVCTRMIRLTGEVPLNPEDFMKADVPFATLLNKFMAR
jgi:hypothetical protein